MKTIRSAIKLSMGHLRLEFTDGTSEIVERGKHELLALKTGDTWPVEDAPEGLKTSRVTEITPRVDGHHDVKMENGSTVTVERGAPVPRVGDEHLHIEFDPPVPMLIPSLDLPSDRDLDIEQLHNEILGERKASAKLSDQLVEVQKANGDLASEIVRLNEALEEQEATITILRTLREEAANAVRRSDEQVQEGQAQIGKQEGSEGNESSASGSNNAIGETGGEA